jgi:transmembrane sensor
MSLSRPSDSLMSEETRAEAAAWMARLRDEQRGPEVETEFRHWLGQSEEHQRAFHRMTQVWQQAGKIRMRAQAAVPATPMNRSRFSPLAAAVAAALVLTFIASLYWRDDAFTTAVGQQRVQVLRDGTRVALNTDTRIEVNYDEHFRRVRLVRGEARFDVSKRPTWPFLVSAGDEEIRALGTSFIVRHDNDQDLSVTLVDGRVTVAPVGRDGEAPQQAPQVLVPGQRLIISRHRASIVDRPELGRVTAWERGRVEFDATPLGDATTEMNRYNTTRVLVADTEIAQLRIGGVFRAGDSEEFVKIVTAALGLHAERNGANIMLSRSPTPFPPPTGR